MSRHSDFLKATLLSALLATAASACADDASPTAATDPFASDAPFLAVPRHVDATTIAARAARKLPPSPGDQDFYLAIKKSELGKKYFLAATIEQSFPGGFNDGLADQSLGSRVVTFRVQNGKLFVFDARDGVAPSSTFDPTILVDAYPIVQVTSANGQSGNADKYVVFDPAAGLNRFSVVSDLFASVAEPTRFQIDLSYLQRFRTLADGVGYQQVFTGYAEDAFEAGPLQNQAFQSSGTLSVTLRSYKESAGFEPVFDDELDIPPHYFAFEQQFVKDEGRVHAPIERWNIVPGMTPIRWLVARELVDFVAANQDVYAGVDVVGAVRRGVEGWNAAIGFTALETRIAGPNDRFSDEEKNFITFDADPTAQFALATTRVNPNTGETRSAEIYFPQVFIDLSFFSDDPPAATPATARRRVTWDALAPHVLCARDAASLRGQLAHKRGLTAGKKLELFIEHTIAHEIGHTLGLRHNFKGSLLPPSSSVMDYLRDPLAIVTPKPGAYDIDAVRFLYGLKANPPAQPFCTDDDLELDPLCAQSDNGTDPLIEYWAPRFERALNGVFDDPGFSDAQFDDLSQGVLSFVRAGAGDEPLRAWELAMTDLRAPVPPAVAADPAAAAAIDRSARLVFDFLLGRGSKAATIPVLPGHPAVLAAIVADLRGNLLNLDGVRSFATRRLVVDVLKKLQRTDAHLALLDGRAQLAARLAAGGLTVEELSLTADLLARIDAATTPYFE